MKKICVIGIGSIGRRHATNLLQLGHEVYGYDPNSFPIIPGLKHITELDEMPSVDAYVIASPTAFHELHIKHCLARGKPFFVEKPVKAKLSDNDGEQATMVGYNLRFHSCVMQAKYWIEQNMIGAPIWANLVCAQLNTKPDYLRGGVILNWSHEIDLALYLLGPATVEACIGTKSIADMILLHGNGCRTTVHLDYLTRPEIRQSIIVGDKGTAIIDLAHRHAWLRTSHETAPISFQAGDSFDSNYLDEMESFIARLDGQETVGCSGKEGIETLKICVEAERLAGAL